MASMFVFGVPLNKLDPNLPGYIENSAAVSTLTSTTKGANLTFSGNRMGQKGAEGHSGTTKVPLALHIRACWTTRGTRYTGGHNQLFSSRQSTVNASTASEPGFQNHELNRGSWVL